MKFRKTPFGDNCIIPEKESRLANLISRNEKGPWQKEVTENLISQGYVIGYLATGKLRGNAKKYQSHYSRSLNNLMGRIKEDLKNNSPYKLVSDRVGPRGAFGYYLTDEE